MSKSFPLVGGRVMRLTRLDGCGRPDYTDPNAVTLVTDGFVSVEVSANVDDGDAITVTNANGKKCVNEVPAPQLTGYGADITFCGVDPDAFALTTAQRPVLDPATGDSIGFRVNTGVNSGDAGFALEIWSRVPGVSCPVDPVTGEPLPGVAEAAGYILFPFLQGGTFGDFTVENDAVSFVIQGAQTKDGSAWGFGPYDVTLDAQGQPSPLIEKIDPKDHLHVQVTYAGVPDPTDGAVGVPATRATAGTPGTFGPTNSVAPANAAAATARKVRATPTTAWTTGQYVQGSTTGAAGQFYWTGTAWAAGKAA